MGSPDIDHPNSKIEEIFSVCLKAGVLMLASGAETSRAEETVIRIAQACGAVDCHTFATPTGIFLSIRYGDQVSTRLFRIPGYVEVNLQTVAQVNAISRRIEREQHSMEQGGRELEVLIKKPPTYPAWTLYLAAFFSAGGFTVLRGGSGWDFLVGGFAGFIADRVVTALSKQVPKFLAVFFGAAVGSLSAKAAASLPALFHSHLEATMIGGIIPLVPGLAVTNAVRDLMAGELLSGVARSAEAVFTSIAIAIGVALALSL